MTDPMTPERLAEIVWLADEASPGPWDAFECEEDESEVYYWLIRFAPGYGWSDCMSKCDADFIASARTAVPELIAEVRRLQARVDELEQDLATAERCHDVVEAEVERLRARVAELEARSEWQPIETFPGIEGCYLVRESGSPFMADYVDGTWWMDSTVAFALSPTHWMPLPEAPEEARCDD